MNAFWFVVGGFWLWYINSERFADTRWLEVSLSSQFRCWWPIHVRLCPLWTVLAGLLEHFSSVSWLVEQETFDVFCEKLADVLHTLDIDNLLNENGLMDNLWWIRFW